MNNELVIPPTSLSLIVTNKCTASCYNCCFACSPKNKDIFTLQEMKNYIDQSVQAYSTIKVLILTGGECFLLGSKLDKIIKYASNKGLLVRVVTNGYWAKSFKTAYNRLKTLVDLGLTEFNLSTGDEHQQWVPYENIINATIASLKLGMVTAINVETSDVSEFEIDDLKSDIRLQKYKNLFGKELLVLGGTWMPFKKSTEEEFRKNKESKDKKKKILVGQAKRCVSLFDAITINSTHKVHCCCGLASHYIPYLYVGSSKKHSLKFLYEYQFEDFLKIWLYTEGPKKILDFCLKLQGKPSIDTVDWHICQICAQIFQNEENIKILRENYQKVQLNVMMQYFILRKKRLKILKLNDYENKQESNTSNS